MIIKRSPTTPGQEASMNGTMKQNRLSEYMRKLDDYRLSTEEFLDRNYGPGTWAHDPYTDDYYVFDCTYTGPGRGYYVLDRKLRCAPISVVVN
jgi:hypothetical protein